MIFTVNDGVYVAVLFRVITVYPDLKPYKEDVNVSISVSDSYSVVSIGKFMSFSL